MDVVWNLLDVGSVWMKEFASAFQKTDAVNAWLPKFGLTAAFRGSKELVFIVDPPLQVFEFPLQRGYAKSSVRRFFSYERKLLDALQAETATPVNSPLVCTSPFYAPVAELWPGKVVYYATDWTYAYPNLDRDQVLRLDRQLCKRAEYVCPNSKRIAEYFMRDAGCACEKVTVLPNATRAANVSAQPRLQVGPLPQDLQHLPRPIVGVLGDLSANMDWPLLLATIQKAPEFHWAFVGPARPIKDKKQAEARDEVRRRSTFVGTKPYGTLQEYARSFDVAVLPYRKSEPTYSGSSTRFYEHLASGRPMIGTRGFAELLEKQDLLYLIDTAEELISKLEELRDEQFLDGHESERWQASKDGTWEQRARTMRSLLRCSI